MWVSELYVKRQLAADSLSDRWMHYPARNSPAIWSLGPYDVLETCLAVFSHIVTLGERSWRGRAGRKIFQSRANESTIDNPTLALFKQSIRINATAKALPYTAFVFFHASYSTLALRNQKRHDSTHHHLDICVAFSQRVSTGLSKHASADCLQSCWCCHSVLWLRSCSTNHGKWQRYSFCPQWHQRIADAVWLSHLRAGMLVLSGGKFTRSQSRSGGMTVAVILFCTSC